MTGLIRNKKLMEETCCGPFCEVLLTHPFDIWTLIVSTWIFVFRRICCHSRGSACPTAKLALRVVWAYFWDCVQYLAFALALEFFRWPAHRKFSMILWWAVMGIVFIFCLATTCKSSEENYVRRGYIFILLKTVNLINGIVFLATPITTGDDGTLYTDALMVLGIIEVALNPPEIIGALVWLYKKNAVVPKEDHIKDYIAWIERTS